ncbi:MAG: GGDEF domain-containing protein, partial [Actinomycetia bacterium]|nr:GGDEF domain-containing protein [Actinomycetes bacterium]
MEKNDFDSFGIFQDNSKEKLAYLALVDDLTGLYNRRYFFQILPQLIVESKKANSTFCLSMMDID